MPPLARIIVVTLLALFATASVVRAAGAAEMALSAAKAPMTDCGACPAGDAGDVMSDACKTVCIAPFAAILSGAAAPGLRPAVVSVAGGVRNVTGRTGPPDPYPPKAHSLI